MKKLEKLVISTPLSALGMKWKLTLCPLEPTVAYTFEQQVQPDKQALRHCLLLPC